MRSAFTIGLCLICSTGIAALPASADAPNSADSSTSAVAIADAYTCDQAEKIKFDQPAYEAKAPKQQRLIDAKYQQCKIDKDAAQRKVEPEETVVLVANPVPTGEEDRLFYGTIKKSDLENVEKNCRGGGATAAIAISIYGDAKSGAMIYQYTDVACKGFADALRGNNMMAVFGPTSIISAATAPKAIDEIVDKIPLVSDADKKVIKDTMKDVVHGTTPTVKVEKDKVHIDIGPGGGVGIPRKW